MGPHSCSRRAGMGLEARLEEVGVGKGFCSGSCVIDAAGYFDCHFLNYVFVWGEEGGFALRFFYFVLFFVLRGLG